MVHSTLRLVAGGGVVAAFLLIADPTAAVAFADRGGSGSSSTHSGCGRSSDHDSKSDKRQGPKKGVDDHRARSNADRVRSSSRNLTREGSTRRTIGGLDRVGTEIDTEPVNQVSPVLTREDLVTGSLAPRGSATVDQSDSSAPSGTEDSGAPTVSFAPPRATFGNGRSPVALNDQPAEPPVDSGASAVPVAAPVGTLPTEAVATPPRRWWVDGLSLPHVDAPPPGQPPDPILGLTVLLMICATGAFLGYRQARASQRAEALAGP